MKPRRLLRRKEDSDLCEARRRINSIVACIAFWKHPDGLDCETPEALIMEIEEILAGDHR